MADAPLPTGPAKGFWKEQKSEHMLMTVVLAKIPRKILQELDMEDIARIVGEGKLSKQSTKAKLTQLLGQGNQRIADSETRLQADDENNEQPLASRDQPTASNNLRDDMEVDEEDSQPTAPRSRKRKNDDAGEEIAPAERTRKKKKDASKKHRKDESHRKEKSRSKEARTEARATNASLTNQTSSRSDTRLTSQEVETALAGLTSAPADSAPNLQATHAGPIKREVALQTTLQPDPALQAHGKSKESAIVIEDLDNENGHPTEQPAGPSRDADRTALPTQGFQALPQQLTKTVYTTERSTVTPESIAEGQVVRKFFTTTGWVYAVQVPYRSRSWQPPIQYLYSPGKTARKSSKNHKQTKARQQGSR